ncbi:MAG: hypothetical protein GY719_10355 [bacterium]|nr:hypothetical protein [bacterium]
MGNRFLASFALDLLGQPIVKRVDADGSEREVAWTLRRALQTVAFLALAPDRRATREALVDALWRDADARSVEKNFHPTLSVARRTLGSRDAFVYRHGVYALNSEIDWRLDRDRYRQLVGAGRRLLECDPRDGAGALGLWLEAWSLYRGPLLDGIDATWIEPERQQLYREQIRLLRDVGDLCVRLERPADALDAYRSLLLQEPFEERVHVAVMELYAQQGRRDLVRRQFVRMQELLVQELNVEPLEETQKRYHQLMR